MVPIASSSRILWIVWLAVCVTLAIWIGVGQSGWDVAVCRDAVRSLSLHHDPYADAIAIQDACHASHCADAPFSYVYSPVTLPALRLIGRLPLGLAGFLYWICYAAAILAQLWVCTKVALENERPYLLLAAPVGLFFPGLLASGTLLSGNVAFIVYAVILLTAVRGWRSNSWGWFYVAVLLASCVKAPWLGLVLIPPLTARRQWRAATATVICGLVLFALQPLLWPDLFRHYLRAVGQMFAYSHDFGCSPAGLFSDLLSRHGIPYSAAGVAFYLTYAVPLIAVLFYLSRRYLDEQFLFEDWLPVMLLGVLLLNPRLIEYDLAPLTLPMAIIVWRFLRLYFDGRKAAVVFAAAFLLLNGIAVKGWEIHKLVNGPLLVVCFGMGSWQLLLRIPKRATSMTSDLGGLLTSYEAFTPYPESVD